MMQHLRRGVRQWRALEDLLPVVRDAAERIVLALTWKDINANCAYAPAFEILDDGKADGANRLTFLLPSFERFAVQLRLDVRGAASSMQTFARTDGFSVVRLRAPVSCPTAGPRSPPQRGPVRRKAAGRPYKCR